MKAIKIFLFLSYWYVKLSLRDLKRKLKAFWRRAGASLGMLYICVAPDNSDPVARKLYFFGEFMCGMLAALGVSMIIGSLWWYIIKGNRYYARQWVLLGAISIIIAFLMFNILKSI